MPAAIDTGGPRVLHCDSCADYPTTPIHLSTSADERRADRARTNCRRGANNLLAEDLGQDSSAKLPRSRSVKPANGDTESRRRESSKDPPRKIEISARTRASERRNAVSLVGRRSLAKDQRIDDKREKPKPLPSRRNVLAEDRALTQRRRSRRRRREDRFTCPVSTTISSRAIENVSKGECLSVTWNSQENASARDKVERVESRLRDETERSRLAIANANGGSFAKRQSLQLRCLSRPVYHGRKDHDSIDHAEGRRDRSARRSPLLSSHHSHDARSRTEESCEEGTEDSSEKLADGRFAGDDAWINENARLGRSEECGNERPEKIQIVVGRDSAIRKEVRRVCRVRSFLRLAFLLFLVAFGRSGLLGSRVLRFSARPSASGFSVLAIGTIIGAVSAAPVDLIGDTGIRAERSANLSHITGASRKIQMYIKHRHLQILPDGTVNGSNDDTSEYTIFQRTSVSRGQLRIQGVATCLYLCMDSCGLLYGSREYTEDCVFNETLEQHNYNTYSSVRWSTPKKTLYLGLNRRGQPRRVQAKGHNLGRLSAYARVLTQMAPPDRVETLQRRMLGAQHNVRHQHHGRGHHHHRGDVAQQSVCPSLPAQEKDGRDRFRCRKRKKRKKRKRRCRPGEQPGPQCQLPEQPAASTTPEATEGEASAETANVSTTPESKRSCEGAASEEACRRQALSVPAKKRKSRIDGDPAAAVVGRNHTLNGKNKAPTSNAKKPNVGGDSQSKKPDLTDGKKRKRKGPATTQARGSVPSSPSSRKRYATGTTSSRASSPRMAPAISEERASTALSSSPSPPGASTTPSVGRTASPPSGRRKPPVSSRNHVARPAAGSRRVGKSFPGTASSPGRPRSTTPRSETANRDPSITTKVPEITTPSSPPPSSPAPLSSLSWQVSAEDSPRSLSDSSLVHEETSVTASSELVTELTTFRLIEVDAEDVGSGMVDTIIPPTTTGFPFEGLAM